ncbi:MAG: M81 family metallopeptidase [Rhizobiaceae bacterium]|nr:M81 family metallopeptidase [Rhizobiaceae bacterium]
MRVAVGSFMQEGNTFVPFKTDIAVFRANYFLEGDEMLTGYGNARSEVPAMFDVLKREGANILPLIATHGFAGGPLTRSCFDEIITRMIARLDGEKVDGVLLALHGAMVVEDNPDAEAEIVAAIRRAVGAGIPIGVSLDLHGHITPSMLQPDVFYIGYQEYPHIDMYETGARTAETLCDSLAGRCRPVMAMRKLPLLVSPVKARTDEAPLAAIMERARAMRGQDGILHAAIFPVQPWLDIPELGVAVLVCADGDQSAAQAAADELAQAVWTAREAFNPDLVSLEQAIRTGLELPGTTVVSDAGDAPSGGSAADSAAVLSQLLAQGADRAGRLTYLTMCDAVAATRAFAVGEGTIASFDLGHAVSSEEGKPVSLEARVQHLSDGEFVLRDRGLQGAVFRQGPTAVLALGDLRIVVRSYPGFEWDTGCFTAFGLDLAEAALVFVKSPSHFRTSFAPHAARIVVADTPGPTAPNVRRLKFVHVSRPLYPQDAAVVDFCMTTARPT